MADLTPEQAIDKLRTLPEDQQRAVLTQLSPESRQGILSKLQAKSSIVSPIPPPKLKPPDVGMHESYLVGDPNKDPAKAGQEDISALGDMATNAAKSIGRVSAPNVAYQMLRKRAPSLGLPEGLGQTSPEEVMLTGIGAAEGAPEASESKLTKTADVAKAGVKTGLPEPPLDPEQQAKYTGQIDKANKDFAEDTTKYQKKVADAATERKRGFAGEKGGPQFEAEKATNRKDLLNRVSHDYTQQSHENIQQTHDAGRGSLDQRWGQFRGKMEGVQLDPIKAADSVLEAEKSLKGSPASLRVFNDLLSEIGIKDIDENGEPIVPPSEKINPDTGKKVPVDPELPFDTARIHYSALMDKIAHGGLAGNVWHAVKNVAEGLDEQLTKAGGEEYTKLKADEHQFRSDWVDAKSPLARAYDELNRQRKLNVNDPELLHGHITGKNSSLLMQQLARYRKFGAKPWLTAAARRLDTEAGAIKVPKAGEPKPLGAKKPTLAEVKRPVPKTEAAKPEPLLTTRQRIAARVAGKLVGGHIAGFPGYIGGGEAGPYIAEKIARKVKGMPPPPEP